MWLDVGSDQFDDLIERIFYKFVSFVESFRQFRRDGVQDKVDARIQPDDFVEFLENWKLTAARIAKAENTDRPSIHYPPNSYAFVNTMYFFCIVFFFVMIDKQPISYQ